MSTSETDLRKELDELKRRLNEREQLLGAVLLDKGRAQLQQLERAKDLASASSAASKIDPTCGVLRHGYFRQRLAFEMSRSTRTGELLGLILVDLDRFSEYNRAAGYERGERTLAMVGRNLHSLWLAEPAARPPIFGRESGNCFGVIAPDISEGELAERSERLRELIERTPLPPPRITASVGAAMYTKDLSDECQLIAACRSALSRAKEGGGNRVIVSGLSVEQRR